MSDDQDVKDPVAKEPEVKSEPPQEPEPTHEERAAALIASYSHGLAHNAPRSQAELDELKALLA